jgi:hypothetical protein
MNNGKFDYWLVLLLPLLLLLPGMAAALTNQLNGWPQPDEWWQFVLFPLALLPFCIIKARGIRRGWEKRRN